jgi:hypothetical protein
MGDFPHLWMCAWSGVIIAAAGGNIKPSAAVTGEPEETGALALTVTPPHQ